MLNICFKDRKLGRRVGLNRGKFFSWKRIVIMGNIRYFILFLIMEVLLVGRMSLFKVFFELVDGIYGEVVFFVS